MLDVHDRAHNYDDRLDQFLREEARTRDLTCPEGYRWMGRLRQGLRAAHIVGLDQDATAAEIFFLLVCRPGSLWGYRAEYGTTLEQRWGAYADARIKDVLRTRARRNRVFPTVPWEDTMEAPRVAREVGVDPAPLESGDPRVVDFRGWLVRQRRGHELALVLDARVEGRGIEETLRLLGVSRSTLDSYVEDLRYYLGLYGQRYPEVAEALAGFGRSTRCPRDASTLRCYVGGEHLVEVRVVGESRVHGRTRVMFSDGSERWVDPRDLLAVLVRTK